MPPLSAHIRALTYTRHRTCHPAVAAEETAALRETQIGMLLAKSTAGIMRVPVMFRITQNTLRIFTLAEVLLMAAMNQLEAERKPGGNEGCLRNHSRAEAA